MFANYKFVLKDADKEESMYQHHHTTLMVALQFHPTHLETNSFEHTHTLLGKC
jgi:anthranilate/para-aminobenzoate synthase component II